MSDAKQHPKAAPSQKPQNQVGENHGAINGPQRTGHNTRTTDTPRGSEVETRNSSNRRG
ncbi:hypothetical protein IDJ81_09990 [Tsuneonella flava]|uniref:Uncharacterized protein n=1 Tax=Tsuneonella flava TaxID=2055955 RepID=A0ABX7K6T8_9SPHN|nr:hypothetical protein [Tsuneonella flava]QSB43699.1 hypothetical protein IDJ81_09990 [Tsuneonella flava]